MKLTDIAYQIDRTKDSALYQNRSTLRLFSTTNQVNGHLELFSFDDGVWHSEGIHTPDKIIELIQLCPV
jgi:hypothetical protein